MLLGLGVSSEMDSGDARRFRPTSHLVLDDSQLEAMRHLLHELANTLTGVMISGGLLSQYLEGHALVHYAAGVCEGCERGCNLVRELRGALVSACGEPDLAAPGEVAQAGRAPDEGAV
jgi:nitrogen-specific signal transduction histidine kinase